MSDDARPMPDAVRGDAVHAEQQQCDACGAVPGEPCGPYCIGLASELDRLEEAAMPDAASGASAPGRSEAVSASSAADAIIARAMTVEASKLYALINLRHLAGELDRP